MLIDKKHSCTQIKLTGCIVQLKSFLAEKTFLKGFNTPDRRISPKKLLKIN